MKKSTKTQIACVVIFAVAFILSYLGAAFVTAEINSSLWTSGQRGTVLFLTVVLWGLAFSGYQITKDD